MALRKLATNYTLLSYHNNSFIRKKYKTLRTKYIENMIF